MKTKNKKKRMDEMFQYQVLDAAKSLRIRGGNGGDDEDESTAVVLDNGSGD